MIQGEFYFIEDGFFATHDPDGMITSNKPAIKGQSHDRPCFYAFPDNKNPLIYWCVPISSKIDKYHKIYDHKIDKQQRRGVKAPKCLTIRFGDVMGMERAFLIQNMFPVTQKYITSTYINKNSKQAVRISMDTERDVITSAKTVLRLVRSGAKHHVFVDIVKIYDALANELES
jgi:hypothetical protein